MGHTVGIIMDWFDVVKDAKREAETFFLQFREALLSQVTTALAELDKDEAQLKRMRETYKAMVSSLSPMERSVIQPIIDRHHQSQEEAEEDIKYTRHILHDQLKHMTEIFRDVEDSPIESKLILLRENMADVKGIDGESLIDVDALDKIIHALGFEGKGME